jgi:hypothetical protein
MLETHIVMSSLMFLLVLTLVLCLTLLPVLFLSSLMDLTITHIVLVHERTALSLDVLVTTHVLIMMTISRVGLVFLQEGFTPVSHPTHSNGDVQKNMKTSSSRMVKC